MDISSDDKRDLFYASGFIHQVFEDRELDMLKFYKGNIVSAVTRAKHNAYQYLCDYHRDFYGSAWDIDERIFSLAWDDEMDYMFLENSPERREYNVI